MGAGKINTEEIPGTIHLVDLEHSISSRHAATQKDVVLVPTPSNDPDDPLNWSPRRKLLATACLSVYTLFVGIASSVIYSVLVPLSDALDLTGNKTSGLEDRSLLLLPSFRFKRWDWV